MSAPHTVVVTGSRYLRDPDPVYRDLDALLERYGSLRVVNGGASGADQLAQQWAEHAAWFARWMGVHVEWCRYPADFGRHGAKAGPIRNRAMLDVERPALVLAYLPLEGESRGTRDCIGAAEERGITVWVREVSA